MFLTRRQQQILDLLRGRAAAEEYPPTYSELCTELGLRSRGSVHKQVQALVRAGYVAPMHGQHRGIRLVADAADADALPLLGKIAAGRPIEAVTECERVQVPAHLRTARACYVLRVEGDSMREAGILDGDYVVIEQREHARNGEIVVALIGGEEATLKRIHQEPGRVVLYPENRDMQATEYHPDQVQIQGVLVGQMRSYR
jgi:repressor LexA